MVRLARLLSRGRMEAPKGECHLTREAPDRPCRGAGAGPWSRPTDAPRSRPSPRASRATPRRCARPASPCRCSAPADNGLVGDDRERLTCWRVGGRGRPRSAARTGGVRFHARSGGAWATVRPSASAPRRCAGFAAGQRRAHMKPEAEVRRLFSGHEEAVDATMRVVGAAGSPWATLTNIRRRSSTRSVAAGTRSAAPPTHAGALAGTACRKGGGQIAHELRLIASSATRPVS
jgi:error-prone DNA polymerase